MQKALFLVLTLVFSFGSAQNTEADADVYFKNGDFNKALIIYKTLYKAKPYRFNYLDKVIKTHQQLEQYQEVQELLVENRKQRPNPLLDISLGYNYQLIDSLNLATPLYEAAIAYVDANPNYVYNIAKKFEDYSLLEQAIRVYNKGKRLNPDQNYSIQLARIYADLGNVELMFSSYLDYIAYKPEYLNTIKRAFTDFISEDSTNENNLFLRKLLLKNIQEQPDTYWYELLSWLYVQEKAYNKSFVQEKALYKRNPESLDRIFELALIASDANADATAKTIFTYILEQSQDIRLTLQAQQYILELDTKAAETDKALQNIKSAYETLFADYGKSQYTLPLQLAYCNFLAFILKDTEAATRFLRASLKLNISELETAKVKLLLADILVLQEKFNEALILYSQIQTQLKNSTISQEARFKVAKTSYYKGDFNWAESQLKILKASTSQLIANDALALKLLISDNKYEDSTQTALNYYAKADLFVFQNKTDQAISLLDKILTEHKGESITDETLLLQAKLFEKKLQYRKAEANYLQIIADYSTNILADDAHYFLAKLYQNKLGQPEDAKAYFEKIIFNFEDSIYFVEARKTYRSLRGDTIN